jgi:hypothetical protein
MLLEVNRVKKLVAPGGCTDARQSKIVRTSTGFRCESCNWRSPSDPDASRSTHFDTKDNGQVSIERALKFFHVLDPQRAGYYFTCPEHRSKAYKSFSQVAQHIQKHHTESEFENALRPS